MSEDTTATADLGDLGSRGERRRALQAERERQAQRQDDRDREAQGEADGRQPDEQAPPLIRPYEVTLQGQETALLVAGGPKSSDADGGISGPRGMPPGRYRRSLTPQSSAPGTRTPNWRDGTPRTATRLRTTRSARRSAGMATSERQPGGSHALPLRRSTCRRSPCRPTPSPRSGRRSPP